MFVLMWLVGVFLLGVMAQPAAATVHCELQRKEQTWQGACPGLLGRTPALSLSPARSVKSGRYRADAEPVAIYAGDMRGQGASVSVELEIYRGGLGILRPEGLTWLVVEHASMTPDTLTLDVVANQKVPPSDLDRAIIVRAAAILSSDAVWDRADDRQCGDEDRTWSIYCAMLRAAREVTGGIHHRRPAMEIVREVVDQRSVGRNYEHRLRDYNNDPRTTLPDVRTLFEDALSRLKPQPR